MANTHGQNTRELVQAGVANHLVEFISVEGFNVDVPISDTVSKFPLRSVEKNRHL